MHNPPSHSPTASPRPRSPSRREKPGVGWGGWRTARTLALLALLGSGGAVADVDFPRPAALEPDVVFWTRVFTEVDSQGGFIHDDEHLGVVYATLRFRPGATDAEESAQYRAAVEGYQEALRALGEGKAGDLTAVEARAREAWGAKAGPETFRAAAERVRFQRGLTDKYRAGYERSGRWRPFILETLRRHGVPEEVAALPHVESSFNPSAGSHAGAVGLWQFTRPTGKLYLRIDEVADERLDPYASTVAAARLLKRNHDLTGTWPLALTAYNHGAGGVRRAIETMGTRDIDAIVRGYRGRAFGFASRNFYTSFLAALDVDRHAHVYFGPVERRRPDSVAALRLPQPLRADVVASTLGLSLAALRESNPALRPAVLEGRRALPAGFELRLARDALPSSAESLLAAARPAPLERRQHKVRRGETLSEIAAHYGISHRELMAINGLRNPNRVRVGQRLRLPVDGDG